VQLTVVPRLPQGRTSRSITQTTRFSAWSSGKWVTTSTQSISELTPQNMRHATQRLNGETKRENAQNQWMGVLQLRMPLQKTKQMGVKNIRLLQRRKVSCSRDGNQIGLRDG